MRFQLRIALVALVASGLIACDSMELTIAVNQIDEEWLEVVNSNDRALKDVRLVVEAFESEGATTPCGEENLPRWEPGAVIRVPACAEKVRFTLVSGGETARFSYSNGQLYRRFGRKEVPITQ
jgi:hypothetical protein